MDRNRAEELLVDYLYGELDPQDRAALRGTEAGSVQRPGEERLRVRERPGRAVLLPGG